MTDVAAQPTVPSPGGRGSSQSQQPGDPAGDAVAPDPVDRPTKLGVVQAAGSDRDMARNRWTEAPERDRALPGQVARVRPRWRRRYQKLLMVTDAVAATLVGALAVAAAERVDSGVHYAGAGRLQDSVTGGVVGLLVVATLVLGRTYESDVVGHGWDEFRRLLTAGGYLVAGTSTVSFALGLTERRAFVLGALPAALVAALLVHLAARLGLLRLRRQGRCQQRTVVIGLERSVAEMVRTMRRDRNGGFDVVAACVSRSRSAVIEGVPVKGAPADVLAVLLEARADTVVLTAWSDVDPEDLRRLSWDLEGSGAELLVAPRLAEVAVPRMHIRSVAGQPLLSVDEPEFTGLRRLAKAVLDYGLTLVGLAVLSPVMLAVALAVRLDSPGPVLFRQERVGRHGGTFRMTKFRSMYADAEERLATLEHLNEHGGGPLFKMRDDPRVTRVGRLIRRYSLDELPQLFDVLAGRMSLVGPRPPLPREVNAYASDVRRRLLVKPGITGLWQVSGRSDLSWDESVRLDLSYVENWTLWLDLSIIARTVLAVLARQGAY